MHLEGKSAIVTGAGRGIGRDVALLLAREGARVIVNDPGVGRSGEPTDERPADDVVNEIKAAGGTAIANYDSVADYQKAGRMVAQCVDSFGKIDILVNVAGMLREKMIWNMSEDDFDSVINVHLKGHWAMSHHAIKYMRREGYGRIVNFSSDAFKGSVGQCNYSAAKAGIIGFSTRLMRISLYTGMLTSVLAFGYGSLMIARYFLYEHVPPGYSSIVVLISFLMGLQFIFLGIFGEYLMEIYLTTKQRPQSLIYDTLNLPPAVARDGG